MNGEVPKGQVYDYMGLYLGGFSTEKIKQKMAETGGGLTIVDEKTAFQRYGQNFPDISEEGFTTLYNQVIDSYDRFKVDEFNDHVMSREEYMPEKRGALSGHIDIHPGRDGIMFNPVPLGVNRYGEQKFSPRELALVDAYTNGYIDEETGERKPFSQSELRKNFFSKRFIAEPDEQGNMRVKAIPSRNFDDARVHVGSVISMFNNEVPGFGFSKGFNNALVYAAMTPFATLKYLDQNYWKYDKSPYADIEAAIGSFLAIQSPEVEAEVLGAGLPYHLGNAIGMLAVQRAGFMGLSRMSLAPGIYVGERAARNMTLGGFGLYGMTISDDAARSVGVDKDDRAWLSIGMGTIEALTESLGGNMILGGAQRAIMRREATQYVANTLREEMTRQGYKSLKNIPADLRFAFARRVGVKSLGFKQTQDKLMTSMYPTRFGRMMYVGVEEGMEEVIAQPLSNTLQYFHDKAHEHLPGRIPGQGLYGETTNPFATIIEGTFSAGVIGFMAGTVGGLSLMRNKHINASLSSFASQGRIDEYEDAVRHLKNKGWQWTYDHIDEYGEIINSASEGKVKTMNEAIWNSVFQRIEAVKTIANEVGLDKFIVAESVEQNVNILADLYKETTAIYELQQELSTLEAIENKTQDNLIRINALKEEVDGRKQRLKEIVTIDEGGKFSPYYLNMMRNLHFGAIQAEKIIDEQFEQLTGKKPTDNDKKSWQYNLKKAIITEDMQLFNNYSTVKDRRDQLVERYAKMQEEGFTKVTEDVESVLSSLKAVVDKKIDITTDKGKKEFVAAVKPSQGKLFDMLDDIVNSRGSYPFLSAEQRQGIADKFKPVFETLRKDYMTDNLAEYNYDPDLGIDGALSDLDAMVGSEQWKQIESEKQGVDEQIVDALGKVENINPLDAAIEGNLLSLTNQLGSDLADNFNSRDNRAINNDFIKAANEIAMLEKFLKVAEEAMPALVKNPVTQKYIQPDDIILTSEEIENYKALLKDYKTVLDDIKNTFGKVRQQGTAEQLKQRQADINLSRMVLAYMLEKIAPSVREAVPDLAERLKAIPLLTEEQRSKDSELSEEDMKAIETNWKAIQDIMELLHAKKDVILTYENIKELVKKRFANPLVQDRMLYGNDEDYSYIHKDVHYLRNLFAIATTEELIQNRNDTGAGYVFLVDFLIRINGFSPKKLYAARESAENANKFNVSTFEQERSENLFINHINGYSSEIFEMVIKAEREVYSTDKNFKAVREENERMVYLYNALFLRGELATGKTQQVPQQALLVNHFLTGKKPKVLFLHLSQEGVDLGVSSMNKVTDVANVEASGMNITDFLSDKRVESLKKYDFIIIDEAGKLTDTHLAKINELTNQDKTIPIIFMGDLSQMLDIGETRKFSAAHQLSLRSLPIIQKWTQKNPVLRELSLFFNNRFMGVGDLTPPGVYMEVLGDGKTSQRHGAKYYGTIAEVIDDFMSRVRDTGKGDLIFYTANDIKEFLEGTIRSEADRTAVKKLFENGKLKSEFKDRVFVLWSDIMNPDNEYGVTDVQGLRRDEVYFAMDVLNFQREYPQHEGQGWISGNAGYTAVGRAWHFFGMVGPASLNLTSKPAGFFIDHSKEVSGNEKLKAKNEKLAWYKLITGGTASATSKTATSTKSQPADSNILNKKDFKNTAKMTIVGGDGFVGDVFKINQTIKQNELTGDTMIQGDVYDESGNLLAEGIQIAAKHLRKPAKAEVIPDKEADMGTWESSDAASVNVTPSISVYPYDIITRKGDGAKFTIMAIMENFLDSYGFLLDNGQVVSLSNFTKDYTKVTGKVTRADGTVRYTHGGKAFKSSGGVFGTSFAVISPTAADGDATALRQENPTVTEKIVSGEYRAELVYLKKVRAFNGKEGKFDIYANALTLKLSAGKTLTPSSEALLQKHPYHLMIANTESDYNSPVTDFSKTDAVINGFADNEYSNDLIELNKTTYNLRKRGVQSNQEELSFGEVRLTKETSDGYIVSDKNLPIDYNDFIQKLDDNVFKRDVLQIGQFPVLGKLPFEGSSNYGPILRVSFSPKATPQSLLKQGGVSIVFQGKPIHRAGLDYLKQAAKEDTDIIKTLNKADPLGSFNSLFVSTSLYRLLVSNSSMIKNNPVLAPYFGEYLTTKAGGMIFFNRKGDIAKALITEKKVPYLEEGKGVALEMAMFEMMWHDIIKKMEMTSNDLGVALFNLHAPVRVHWEGDLPVVNPSSYPVMETYVQDIHYPGVFVNIKELTDNITKPGDADEFSTIKPDRIKSFMGDRVMETAMLEKMLTDMLHPSVWQQVKQDGLKPRLFDLSKMYGYYHSGRIYYDLRNGGVRLITAKHEVAHFVFDILDDASLRLVLDDAKVAMRRVGIMGEIGDLKAEEWLARKYGRSVSGSRYATQYENPWYTPSGLLERFVGLLNGIYDRISDTPVINDFFNKIDRGEFKHIVPAQSDTFRADSQEYDDGEVVDMSQTRKLDEEGFIEASVEAPPHVPSESYKARYSALSSHFGSVERVSYWYRRLALEIQNATYFSMMMGRKDFTPISLTRAIEDTVDKYYDEHRKGMLGETYLASIGKVNDVYNKRGELLDEIRGLPHDQRLIYEEYLLYNEDIIKVFVSKLYDGYDVDKGKFKRSNQASTQYASTMAFSPQDGMTSQIRFLLSMTPKINWKKDGLTWARDAWKGGINDFINRADTEFHLQEVGITAYNLWRNDPNTSLFEAFINELEDYSEKLGISNERTNNLKSVLFRFFRGGPNHTSLYEYAQGVFEKRRLNKRAVTRAEMAAAEEIMDMLTAMVSWATDYTKMHSVSSRVTGMGDDQRYRLRPYDANTFAREKDKIKEQMIQRMYDATGDDFRRIVYDKMRGNEQKGTKKTFEVNENGLQFRMSDGNMMPIIDAAGGKITFNTDFLTDPARIQILDQMQSMLGLNQLRGETLKIFLEEVENPGIMQMLAGYFQPTSLKDFLAESLMGMYWSVESHLDYMDNYGAVLNMISDGRANELSLLAQNLGVKMKKKDLTKDVIEKMIEEGKTDDLKTLFKNFYVSNQKYYDNATNTLSGLKLNNFRIDKSRVDALEEMFFEEDVDVEDPTRILKPMDFYVPLNVIAFVNSQIKGIDSHEQVRRADNSRIWTHQLRSLFSNSYYNGSFHVVSAFRQMAEQDPTILQRSVFFDPAVNEHTNMVHAGIMSLQRTTVHQGLRHNKNGVVLPSERDVSQMMVDAFVQGIVNKASKMSKSATTFYLPVAIMGGTQDIYFAEWQINRDAPLPLNIDPITVTEVDSKGNIASVRLNEDFFNKVVEMEFRRLRREMELSIGRWMQYIRSVEGVEGTFKPDDVISRKGKPFNPTNLNRGDITLTPQQFELLMRSDLYESKDYLVVQRPENQEGVLIGDAIIRYGNALTFEAPGLNHAYSWHNHQLLFDKNGNFKLKNTVADIAYRDNLFSENLKNMANYFSDIGHKVRPDVAALVDKSNPYYKNVSEKDPRIAVFNPIYKAMWYMHHAAGNSMGNQVFGHVLNHTGVTDKIKRQRPKSTGGHRFMLNRPRGLNSMSKFAVIDDLIFTDPVTGTKLKISDGGVWGSMLYDAFMRKSFGDYTFGPIGNTRYKTVYNHTNPVDGNVDEHKKSDDYYSSQMFAKFEKVRAIQLDMLQSMDMALARKYPDMQIGSLAQRFVQYLNNRGTGNAITAFEDLADWIEYDSGFADIIKSELLYGLIPKSVTKQAPNRINLYTPGGLKGELATQDFHNEDLAIVLNAESDISEDRQQSPPQQLLSYVGFGEVNRGRMQEVMSIQGNMYEVAKTNIAKEMGVDPALSVEEYTAEDLKKVKDFMISHGRRAMEAFSGVGQYGWLMQKVVDDPNMIHHVAISQKLKQMYKNFLNREAIRITYSGVRFNQSSGWLTDVFDRGGVVHTFDEVESEAGRMLMPFADVSALGFQRRPLKDMTIGETAITPGEVIMPYIHRIKFGLTNNETINEAYTIAFVGKDAKLDKVNVRGMDIEEIDAIIMAKVREGNSVVVEQSPMFKTDLPWMEWLTSFEESLKTILSRVPGGSLTSASAMKIVVFLDDHSNTGYIPDAMNARTDADDDIDQLTAYTKTFNRDLTPVAEGTVDFYKNRIFDITYGEYMDVNNVNRIFIPSSVNDIVSMADEVEAEGKIALYENDLATMIQMYKTSREGSQGIGILAMALSTTGYLAGLGPQWIAKHAPGMSPMIGMLEQTGKGSFYNNLKDWLQVVLDNEKNFAIGKLGISKNALGVLSVMILNNKTKEEIRDFFAHPSIRKVFDFVSEGENIDESSFEKNIFMGINEQRKRHSLNYLEQEAYDELGSMANLQAKIIEISQEADRYLFSKEKELLEMIRKNTEDFIYDKSNVNQLRKDMITDLAKFDPQGYIRLMELWKDINTYERIIEKMTGAEVINDLYEYAVNAEAMRRASRVIKLRDGIMVMDYDVYDYIHKNMELYTGMFVEDYKLDSEYNLVRYLDFYKENSDQYRSYALGTNPDIEILDMLLQKETDIAEAMNISQFLRDTQFGRFYVEMAETRKIDSRLFLEDHPYFRDMAQAFLDSQLRKRFGFAGQYQDARGFSQKMWFDDHAKRVYGGKDYIDLSIPFMARDGQWLLNTDSAYARLDLAATGHQELFKKQFPQFFNFLKDVRKLPEGQAREVLQYMGFDEDFFDEIVDNALFEDLILFGMPGREYIRLGDSYNMSEARLDKLQQSFARLPKYLQDLLVINQFLNTGFTNRRGSISEITGPVYFEGKEGFASSMQALFDRLSGSVIDEQLFERLREALAHQGSMSPYLSRDMRTRGFFPETVKKNVKVKGFNIPMIHRLRPGHTEFSDPDLKYVSESVLFNGELFDISQPNVVPDMIVKFTADELGQLETGSVIEKRYPNGHTYTYSSESEDKGFYFTETGLVVKVTHYNAIDVHWQKVDKDVSQRIQIRQEQNEQARQDNFREKMDAREKFMVRWQAYEKDPVHGIKNIIVIPSHGVVSSVMTMAKGKDIGVSGLAFEGFETYSGTAEKLAKGFNIRAYENTRMDAKWRARSAVVKHVVDRADVVVLMGDKNQISKELRSDIGHWAKHFNKPVLISPTAETLFYHLVKHGGNVAVLGVESKFDKKIEEKVTKWFDKFFAKQDFDFREKDTFVNEISSRAMQARYAGGLRLLVDKMQEVLPQLRVALESDADFLAKNVDPNVDPAYVDKYGVHFNVDRLHPFMPMHETQHIFTAIAKEVYPEVYSSWKQQIEKELYSPEGNEIRDIASIIENKWKKAGLPYSPDMLIREIISFIAGTSTIDIVVQTMNQYGATGYKSKGWVERMMEKVRGLFESIWDTFMNIFMPNEQKTEGIYDIMSRMPLRDFFAYMADRMFVKGQEVRFNKAELDAIKGFYDGDVVDHMTMPEGVGTTTDLIKIFDPALSVRNHMLFDHNPEVYIERHIAMLEDSEKNGKYRYHTNEKVYEYSKDKYDTREKLRKLVIEEILPRQSKFETSIAQSVAKTIQAVKNGFYYKDAIKEGFGYNAINTTALYDIMQLSGANGQVMGIYTALELKTHPTLKDLYDPAFDAFNYIYVLHSTKNGVYDISIVDITTDFYQQSSGIYAHGNILGAQGISNSVWKDKGGTYNLSKGNVRRMLLGLTLANLMRKTDGKVKIRNAGVMYVGQNNFMPDMILDYDIWFKNIQAVGKVKEVMDNLAEGSLKETFMSGEDLFNPEKYQQSWLRILQTHLNQAVASLRSSEYIVKEGEIGRLEAQLALIEGGNPTMPDLIKLLRYRQLLIKEKKRNNQGHLNAQDRQEEIILSKSVQELQTGYGWTVNKVQDMTKMESKIAIGHNLREDALQWLVERGKIGKAMWISEYIKYHDKLLPLAAKVVQKEMHEDPMIYANKVWSYQGSKVFDPMVKKDTAIAAFDFPKQNIKKGDRVSVRLPEYFSMKDDANKNLITNDQQAYGEALWTAFRDVTIRRWVHQGKKHSKNYDNKGNYLISYQDMEAKFDAMVPRGVMPVITKEIGELVAQGEFGEAFKRFTKKMIMPEEVFNENLFFGNKNIEEVSNYFNIDFKADALIKSRLYAKAGLEMRGGELYVTNLEVNQTMSTNLALIMDYYIWEGLREIIADEQILPVYNDLSVIYKYYEHVRKGTDVQNGEAILKNNMEWATAYVNRLVHRKTEDKPGAEVVIIGSMLNAFAYMSLAFKPMIGIRSATWNELNTWYNSIATSIASGFGDTILPGSSEFRRAHAESITDFKKMRDLAIHLQVIMSTEKDILENPLPPRQKGMMRAPIVNDFWSYFMNAVTDYYGRMIPMAAMMIKEGSYDAWTRDKKTGELSYDEKKDRRYWHADGTQTHDQKVLLKGAKDRMVEQDLMKPGDKTLPQSHDWDEAINRLRWYSDHFVIGAIDNDSKWRLVNDIWGRIFGQFRTFSSARFFTFGLYAGERKTRAGAKYVPFQREDGEWISRKELIENEGAIQSFNKALKWIKDHQDMSFREWYGSQSEITRMNLARNVLKVMTISLLVALGSAFLTDDEKRKFAWIYSDLSLMMLMFDFVRSPAPIFGMVIQLARIAFGEASAEKFLKYRTPAGAVYQTADFFGLDLEDQED